MSDLVGNPEDRFSHNEAHIMSTGPASDVCPGVRDVNDDLQCDVFPVRGQLRDPCSCKSRTLPIFPTAGMY